jgi:ketosteroid isomerase-like protein
MISKNPEEVALEFVECINNQDLDGLIDLMTDDHKMLILDESPECGREVMREAWAGYFSAFQEYKIFIHKAVALDEVVVLIGRTTDSHIPPGDRSS